MYEVDGPLRLRFNRYSNKYAKGENGLTLDEFIDLDEKLKYNTDEYSLFNILSEQQQLIKRRFYNKSDDLL